MEKRWQRIEKRLERRYNIPMRAILSFTDAPIQDLQTLNISSGGAFIITNQITPAGTEVSMSLFMNVATDEKIEERGAIQAKGTEVFMSQFMAAIPYKTMGERIEFKFKGVVKRNNNHGMAVCFDNQSGIARM
jgi:hypothetical protein